MTFPPEPLVQIQNNFREVLLMMASTKNAQTVLLGLIQEGLDGGGGSGIHYSLKI